MLETHTLEMEFPISSRSKRKHRWIDVALVAKDTATHVDIRFECKIDDVDKAFGQCTKYSKWGLRPGATTKVYAYFPKEQDADDVRDFEDASFGLLWPGMEGGIVFTRSS